MPDYDGDIKLAVDLVPGDIKSTAQDLADTIKDIFDKFAGEKVSTTFKSMQASIANTVLKAENLRAKLEELEVAKIPTDEYTEISKVIDTTQSKLDSLAQKMHEFQDAGGDIRSDKFHQMTAQAEQLRETIEYARGELQNLVDTGQAFRLGSETEEYERTVEQLNAINNSLIVQEERLEAAAQAEQEGIQNTNILTKSFTRLGKVIGTAAKRLALFVGKSILKGIKALGNRIKQLTNNFLHLGRHVGSGTLSIKKLIGAALGIRGLMGLFRKLRSIITEGFKAFADSSTKFAEILNQFKNSLATLKNSFVAAFAPIAQVIMPILSQFMNVLSQAATKFGMFIASLTGAKTFMRAKQVQKDYNEELNNTAKAAKTAQKQLAGFDDINILQAPDTGETAAEELTQQFEEVPIEFGISDFAEKIKKFFEDQDWDGLGTFVGEKINNIFTKVKEFISWDNLGEKITEVVNGITTAVNSLVDTIDWELIGSTFATGFNTLIYTLDLLITGINWRKLGDAFATGILGFVDTIDWDKFAELIANGITAVFDLAGGFFKKLRTGNLATKLATAINKIIEQIKKKHLGEKLAEILSDIVSMAFEFFANIDYGEALIAMYEFLMDLFENIDITQIAGNITKFLTNLLKGLANALSKISFLDLVMKIQDASEKLLEEIDWGQIGRSLLRFIVVLIERLAIELPGLIINSLLAPIKLILGGIEKLINNFGGNVNLTGWIDDVKNNVSTLSEEASKRIDETNAAFDRWDAKAAESRGNTEAAMSGMNTATNTAFTGIDNTVKEKTESVLKSYTDFLDALNQQAEEDLYDNVTVYDTAAGKIYEVIDKAGKKRLLTEEEYNKEIVAASQIGWDDIVEVVDVGGKKMFRVVDKNGNDMLLTYEDVMKKANYSTSLRLKELKTTFGKVDLVPEGKAVLQGFEAGLDAQWSFLDGKTKAQAAQIKRNYADAFDIHSPSRWFRDKIGKMIPIGLAEGIEDEENAVLKAIDNMTSIISTEASTGIKIPEVALGGVVPYAVQVETNSIQSTLNDLTSAITGQDRLTREDLYSILAEVIRENVQFDFYIGDEQLARHSQAGAMKLNRRYSPVGGY